MKDFSYFVQIYSLYKHFFVPACLPGNLTVLQKSYQNTGRQAVKKEISPYHFKKSICLLLLPFLFWPPGFIPLFSLYAIQLYFIVNQYKNKPLYLLNLHNIIIHIDVTNVKNLTAFSCQNFNILSFCVFCIKTSVYFVQNQGL